MNDIRLMKNKWITKTRRVDHQRYLYKLCGGIHIELTGGKYPWTVKCPILTLGQCVIASNDIPASEAKDTAISVVRSRLIYLAESLDKL